MALAATALGARAIVIDTPLRRLCHGIDATSVDLPPTTTSDDRGVWVVASTEGTIAWFTRGAATSWPPAPASLQDAARVLARLANDAAGERLSAFVRALGLPAACLTGDLVALNAEARALLDWAGPAVIDADAWFRGLYGEDAATMRAFHGAERQQAASRTYVVTLRTGGAERLVECTVSPFGTDEVWLLADASERITSRERFRVLFERSSTAYVLFDNGKVVDCNPAAASMLRHTSRASVIGLTPLALARETQPDGSASGPAWDAYVAKARRAPQRFDWTYRTASDTTVPVEVTLTPLTADAVGPVLAEWHDISARVGHQAVLEAARDSALQFARAKADFLATMSHEIRTPMNGVIGMTRLLLDTPLTQLQREYVETVRACGEGLISLTNDILDFSRLDAGKLELESIPFSLDDVVEDALAVMTEPAHQKQLELATVAHAGRSVAVMGDPARLRQVVLNLLSNAVKFTSRGAVWLDMRATPAGPTRVDVTLEVHDTGIGIAPDAVPRLFSAFSQEDTSTTRRFGGSGLGLAICKRLVVAMGGDIGVVSTPTGSCFSVQLTLPTAPTSDLIPSLHGRTILVATPRAHTRHGLRLRLEATGAHVDEAATLDEALALVPTSELVLGDVTWGPVLERARRSGRPCGVLATARESSESVAALIRLPARRRDLWDLAERALTPSGLRVMPPPPTVTTALVGRSVLVAEDNPVNQRVIQGLLARLGCTVHLVENGQLALEAMASGRFDGVLMDCQMPVLDGLDATRSWRAGEKSGHLPIIALTAGVMEGDRQRCLDAGM
ncbi:MAG: response regulator, partial [Archangium sp.]|nr:response regulator [Archangium sp.]